MAIVSAAMDLTSGLSANSPADLKNDLPKDLSPSASPPMIPVNAYATPSTAVSLSPNGNGQNQQQQSATLILFPLNDSFLDARRLNLLDQGVLLGRLIDGQPATPNTFDSKVVSRKHAHSFS